MDEEMSFLDEVRKTRNDSYNKWFDRWYEKISLENQIKKSAMQGYKSSTIRVSEESDEYIQRRLQDNRIIEKLQEKMPGFDIEYIETSGDRVFLGNKVGTWYKKVISIRWE